jgi:hypothetical protein
VKVLLAHEDAVALDQQSPDAGRLAGVGICLRQQVGIYSLGTGPAGDGAECDGGEKRPRSVAVQTALPGIVSI